jgi:hypothetical protein
MRSLRIDQAGGTVLQTILILGVVAVAICVSMISIRAARIEARDEINAAQAEVQYGRSISASQVEIIDAQAKVIAALMKAEATQDVAEKKTAMSDATAGMEEVQRIYKRLSVLAQTAPEGNQ